MTKKRTKGKFIISATGMQRFSTCPRQYKLGKELEPLQMPSFVTHGKRVHEALAGQLPQSEWTEKEAQDYFTIKAVETSMGYDAEYREAKQYFPISDDIDGVRIIDFIGKQSGEPVLVDYKFPVRKWWTEGNITSKARGWQPAMYLMMPYIDYLPTKTMIWPGRLDFLVYPTSIYVYHSDVQKEKEVIEQAKIIKYAEGKGYFPRNEGVGCRYCSFFNACHKNPGWENEYKDRKREEENEQN